jgi:diaminopimelate decarboxylase
MPRSAPARSWPPATARPATSTRAPRCSRATTEFRRALAGRDALVCYAVKANSNLAILNLFARAGAGFDIVSGGELARVLAAGGDPAKWCFPASARRRRNAPGADAGIFCFNVESAAELERLNESPARSANGADRAARESGRRPEDASLHLHRGCAATSSASPTTRRWPSTAAPRRCRTSR